MKKKRTTAEKKSLTDKLKRVMFYILSGVLISQVDKNVESLNVARIVGLVSCERFEDTVVADINYEDLNITNGRFVPWNRGRGEKEVITKSVSVGKGDLVCVTVNGFSKGKKVVKRNSHEPARVMVRVCIDGIEYGVDSAVYQGSEEMVFHAAASIKAVLSPGDHNITVEGIFTGPLEEKDAFMNCTVETKTYKKLSYLRGRESKGISQTSTVPGYWTPVYAFRAIRNYYVLFPDGPVHEPAAVPLSMC